MTEAFREILQRGIELMAAAKFEAARALFSKALEIDNKNVEAYLHLGNACVNLEDYAAGIDAFKKAQILTPDSFEILYSLGCAQFLNGNNVEAVRLFNQIEKNGDETVEMYEIMQAIFVEEDDLVQAVRCANRAIKLNPFDPVNYVNKAQLYVAQDKPREALATLRESEELMPDSGDVYMVEVQILMELGDTDQALEITNRALARFPNDAHMMLLKCRVLNELARYRECMTLLDEVKAHAPNDALFRRDMTMVESVARVGLEDVEGSMGVIEEIVKDEAIDEDLLFLLGNECYAVRNWEKLADTSERLIAIPDVQLRYKAAGIFWGAMATKGLEKEGVQEAFEKALSSLRQINIMDAGLVEVYVYRALINAESGDFEDALALIDHVIALSPDTAPSYAIKSQILDMQGDKEAAASLREKVKELDPGFQF